MRGEWGRRRWRRTGTQASRLRPAEVVAVHAMRADAGLLARGCLRPKQGRVSLGGAGNGMTTEWRASGSSQLYWSGTRP